jgi:hypothetical protein
VPDGVVIHTIYLCISSYAFERSMKSREGGLFDRRWCMRWVSRQLRRLWKRGCAASELRWKLCKMHGEGMDELGEDGIGCLSRLAHGAAFEEMWFGGSIVSKAYLCLMYILVYQCTITFRMSCRLYSISGGFVLYVEIENFVKVLSTWLKNEMS